MYVCILSMSMCLYNTIKIIIRVFFSLSNSSKMHKLVYNFLHYKLNKPTLTFEMVFRHFFFCRFPFYSNKICFRCCFWWWNCSWVDVNSICSVVVKPVLVVVIVSMFSHFVANAGNFPLSTVSQWASVHERILSAPISIGRPFRFSLFYLYLVLHVGVVFLKKHIVLDFVFIFCYFYIRSILNFTVSSGSMFALILVWLYLFLPKRFAYLPCLLCYFIVKFMHGCDFDVVFIQHWILDLASIASEASYKLQFVPNEKLFSVANDFGVYKPSHTIEPVTRQATENFFCCCCCWYFHSNEPHRWYFGYLESRSGIELFWKIIFSCFWFTLVWFGFSILNNRSLRLSNSFILSSSFAFPI